MKGWPTRREINRCVAVLAAVLTHAAVTSVAVTAAGADDTVRLIVDYGDGAAKIISRLPWTKGITILDVMKTATTRPHGISFSFTGSGDSAVLTKIDDVQNQGGGTGKKNWQYRVNGAYGDRSFAVFELQAQDLIVWRFTTEPGQ